MGNTLIDLVNDLEKEVKKPTVSDFQAKVIYGIIDNARAGEYHDFLNYKFAAPKMALHRDLLIANLGTLAQKVVDGAYDDEGPEDKLPSYEQKNK